MDRHARWNYRKLQGVEDFEYLKRQAAGMSDVRVNKVTGYLLRNLDYLIDSVVSNEDPKIQLKMLGQVRKWYDSHAFHKPMQEQVRKSDKLHFTSLSFVGTTKNKNKFRIKSTENSNKDRVNWKLLTKIARSELDGEHFEAAKLKMLNKWCMEKTRSNEDLLYKVELKKGTSVDRLKIGVKDRTHYADKLKRVHDRHKELIKPLYFTFDEQKREFSKSPMVYDLEEIEQIKRRFAQKKIRVSAKVIEPCLQYERPEGKISFPRGGDGLLKLGRSKS